jgi:Raf kinase inhibitor-like YbhB/YbcL family protein
MTTDKIDVRLNFEKFPIKFTGEGENTSPPIDIEGAKGASMALIVDDPDAPAGTWVHWVLWNMPVMSHIPGGIPKERKLVLPIKAIQGMNTGREIGYDGPYPPKGHGPHRYFFKVYVLDGDLDLPAGATKKDLEKAMAGKMMQMGEAMATFERK